MSNETRIQCMFLSFFTITTIVFIVITFGVEMFNTKASATFFTTTTTDKEKIEVIILTDKPYSEETWKLIKATTIVVAKQTKFNDLIPAFKDNMENNNWSIITISTSRVVYKINE